MGVEVILGVVASIVTTLTGLGMVLEKNGRRIDKRFDSVERKFDTVIELVTDMRANLPLQYTLKEDHVRLTEKVEKIQNDLIIWKHKETSS
jgi:hypothetical protein